MFFWLHPGIFSAHLLLNAEHLHANEHEEAEERQVKLRPQNRCLFGDHTLGGGMKCLACGWFQALLQGHAGVIPRLLPTKSVLSPLTTTPDQGWTLMAAVPLGVLTSEHFCPDLFLLKT